MMILKTPLAKIIVIVTAAVASAAMTGTAVALKSDREQPALITADEIEMDFKTGERVYTGNVEMIQGTTRLTADKVIGRFSGDKLQKATAYGAPAVFKQRPDDADGDVTGSANKMVLDQVNQTVTLLENATITQADGSSMKSARIDYNMETQKMKATGGTQTEVQPKPSSKNDTGMQKQSEPSDTSATPPAATTNNVATDNNDQPGAAAADETATKEKGSAASPTDNVSTTATGRIKIVIPPKKTDSN